MDGLIEGRIVHYVMPNGEHRPAMVTKVWSQVNGCSNLHLFTDFQNDVPYTQAEKDNMVNNYGFDLHQVADGKVWRTSIAFSEETKPHTWHWIERA